MAMTVPGQQRPNTRFTFGQSDRFQRAIQNRLQLQQNVEKLKAEGLTDEQIEFLIKSRRQ